MSRIEHAINVDVPLRVAYGQWTQFESFPVFMEGVKSVIQLDDKTLEWTARVGGQERQWIAEIVDQTPFTRIAWKSVEGTQNAGAVMFAPIGADRTHISLVIDTEPDSPLEAAGDALGFVDRQVDEDLHRFKAFIEGRDAPTGSWSGEIHGDEVRSA